MVAALALVALLAASSARDEKIAASEARMGGRTGMAALDSASGEQINYRPNERFRLCSTFKFLAAAAILKNVDAGKEQLNRFVSYGNGDLLEYAPVTREHLKEGGTTMSALCAAALQKSDNTAGNLLLRARGGPADLTRFLRAIGDPATRSDRAEPG